MVSPDYLTIALRKGRVMTLRLDQLVLGDFVLGFDVKTQLPAFSKLILWSEANWSVNVKYLLIELEDGTQLKVKGDQLIITEGEPIIISPTPEIDEKSTETEEKTPEIAETKSETDETKSKTAEKKSKRKSKTDETKSKSNEKKTKTTEKSPEIAETTPLITEAPPEETEKPPDIIIPTSNIVLTRTVKRGDSLYKRNVGYVPVKRVKKITEKGFCRPITANGTILVNNVAISCYHNFTELYIREKHVMSAQMKGQVGYGPLVFWRKFFKGDVSALTELEKPHTYGVLVSYIFGVKKNN